MSSLHCFLFSTSRNKSNGSLQERKLDDHGNRSGSVHTSDTGVVAGQPRRQIAVCMHATPATFAHAQNAQLRMRT